MRTNGSYRYANSIEDIIERAEALERANDELHSVLEQFGSRLQSNFMGMSDIE